MELKNRTLEDWLKNAPDEVYQYSKKIDFYSPYKTLKDYLVREVHSQVTIGANLKDPDILINDHGHDHVDTVIERATSMVCSETCELSPLEVFMLLVAIQLHDVGNIFGRYEHELNVDGIILEADKLVGRDNVDRQIIRNIAQAHGGEIRGIGKKKDTIGALLEKEPLLDGDVRQRAIAGILRFADELADDKRRAFTTLLHENKVPKKSEVFHAYAACLDAVKIDHKEKCIELIFRIPKDYMLRKFGKMSGEIYLLDEIYNRVVKMHLERIYCMRFCRGLIEINKIFVYIKFFDKYLEVFKPITFEVYESGYPEADSDGIYGLCPSLKDEKGKKIDGEYVRRKLIGEQ